MLLLFLAMQGAYGTSFHEVSSEPSGLHVVWARPLAGGPIRALFVAPRFTLGDVPELSARLDLRYETVALWSAFHVGYDPMAYPEQPSGGRAADTLARLERLMRNRHDVVVLANFDTDILPEEMFSRLLDKVADGAGLLIVQPRNSAGSPLHTVLSALEPMDLLFPITHGVAECAYPGGGPQDVPSQVYAHGRGRIVVLDYPGDAPDHHCLIQAPADPLDLHDAYADNAWSLAARALCVAAGRLGNARIAEVRDIAPAGPDEDEIPPDFYPEFVQAMRDSVVAQPARPFQLVLHEDADQRYNIQAQLRRVDSKALVAYRDPDVMARGARTHQFEIPVGPGVYFVDVWLHTRRGVADWYSTEIIVPGWPEFFNLNLDKTYLLPNDSLEASLDVRPVLNTTRRATIYMRAVDSFGRLVSDVGREVSHEGGTVTLRMHFSDLLAPLLKIEVYAVESRARRFSEWELLGAFRDVRYIGVRQRQPQPNLEMVAAADAPRSSAQLRYFHALSALGVTTLHAPAGEASIVHAAKQHLRLLPELDRFAVEVARDGVYREPCLNDPIYHMRTEEHLRDRTLQHWAGAYGRYSVGGSNFLCASEENVCQCRHCLDRFQARLQTDYDSLTALNQGWGTAFGDWDFIELPEALGPGHNNPAAPWVDFRTFMDDTFSDFHGWARSIIISADPGGRAGGRFLHDTNTAHGYYWPELLGALDFSAVEYTPLMVDKLRSYSKPGAWSGISLTGAAALADARYNRWLPWHLLFNQTPALWLDHLYGDSRSPTPDAWLYPDGGATEALSAIAETVREARERVAPLLLAASPDAASIAIYDSHPSRHVCTVDPTYQTTYIEAQSAAANLLRLAGHTFVFLDKARLPASEKSSCKAIVLPMARALDDEEIAALRAFVADGGALIADILPGLLDRHGNPRTDAPTASLFGVEAAEAPDIQRAVLRADALDTESTGDLGWVESDAAVSVGQGVPLATADASPAWITHRYGAGHVLLLNYPFRDVVRRDRQRLVPGEFNAMNAFIRDLPGADSASHDFDSAFLGAVYRYRYGEALLYAIHADFDAPRQNLRLPFNRDDHVYDLWAGETVRRPHRSRIYLGAGEPRVLARLPYRVREILLNAPEAIHAGQALPVHITVLLDEGHAGKHCFRLDLMPQGGTPIPWYQQIIHAESGSAETMIPLALSDIPGRYTLRVRDMLTGLETETRVAISSPTQL